MFATISQERCSGVRDRRSWRIAQLWGMQARDVDWLKERLDGRPRGFQADVARLAGLTPDKLSKILNGRRELKHSEGEALKDAIRAVEGHAPRPETERQLLAPEGSVLIDRIIGRRPAEGRPAELVFLLRDRNYIDFQLDSRLIEQLRLALREILGS